MIARSAGIARSIDSIASTPGWLASAGLPARSVDPFGRAFPVVAGAALLCFGGLGLLFRLTLGESIPALAAYLVVGSIAYALLLLRFDCRSPCAIRHLACLLCFADHG